MFLTLLKWLGCRRKETKCILNIDEDSVHYSNKVNIFFVVYILCKHNKKIITPFWCHRNPPSKLCHQLITNSFSMCYNRVKYSVVSLTIHNSLIMQLFSTLPLPLGIIKHICYGTNCRNEMKLCNFSFPRHVNQIKEMLLWIHHYTPHH